MKIVKNLLISLLLTLIACQSKPVLQNEQKSFYLGETSATALALEIQPGLVQHPSLSSFTLLLSGQDALLARLFIFQKAEKSLDIQTYIWHNDLTGGLVGLKLLEAAQRGVRVRLLIDGLRETEWVPLLKTLALQKNIEIRIFNPFLHRRFNWIDFVTRFSQANRRMHNKSIVVDNQVAVVGGRNIGDEYFQASDDLDFGDLDVLTAGPVVTEVSKSFDDFWNNELAVPLGNLYDLKQEKKESLEVLQKKLIEEAGGEKCTSYLHPLAEIKDLESLFKKSKLKTRWAHGQLFYDSPAKILSSQEDFPSLLGRQLVPTFEESQKNILIISPYFIPGPYGLGLFKNARQKNIKITVLTNSLAANDVKVVHAAYAKYREDLLKMGVELYELRGTPQQVSKEKRKFPPSGSSHGGLHGKAFFFDDQKIFIGSINLDPRSKNLNTEMGIMIDSPDLTSNLANGLRRRMETFSYKVQRGPSGHLKWTTVEDGQEQSYSSEPEVSLWRRFLTSLSFLFTPEFLL